LSDESRRSQNFENLDGDLITENHGFRPKAVILRALNTEYGNAQNDAFCLQS
jgi:hypothetical protein